MSTSVLYFQKMGEAKPPRKCWDDQALQHSFSRDIVFPVGALDIFSVFVTAANASYMTLPVQRRKSRVDPLMGRVPDKAYAQSSLHWHFWGPG